MVLVGTIVPFLFSSLLTPIHGQLMCVVQAKQKGVISLWHWSHMLEHKVLGAWLSHTREKKRKAERYAHAMERHRHRLLGVGVRQWIRVSSVLCRGQGRLHMIHACLQVATHRKAQREEEALNIQAKVGVT